MATSLPHYRFPYNVDETRCVKALGVISRSSRNWNIFVLNFSFSDLPHGNELLDKPVLALQGLDVSRKACHPHEETVRDGKDFREFVRKGQELLAQALVRGNGHTLLAHHGDHSASIVLHYVSLLPWKEVREGQTRDWSIPWLEADSSIAML